MKKGTKFVLFTAAAGAAAYWGSKLVQQIRRQNDELNEMIENATSQADETEDYEDICRTAPHCEPKPQPEAPEEAAPAAEAAPEEASADEAADEAADEEAKEDHEDHQSR